MNILNREQIADVVNANSKLQAAQDTRWEYCKNIFRPGTVLLWRSRGYLQRGIVEHGVVGSPWHIGIRTLNSKTEKIVDVDLFLVDWAAMKSQAESYEQVKEEVGE